MCEVKTLRDKVGILGDDKDLAAALRKQNKDECKGQTALHFARLPNPDTCTLEELEVAMDCGSDNKVFRRLNASHLLLVGASYDVVLRNSRVCERMFRLWISRFNAQGARRTDLPPSPRSPTQARCGQYQGRHPSPCRRSFPSRSNPLDRRETLRLAARGKANRPQLPHARALPSWA